MAKKPASKKAPAPKADEYRDPAIMVPGDTFTHKGKAYQVQQNRFNENKLLCSCQGQGLVEFDYQTLQ
jgi:hypothetical protein